MTEPILRFMVIGASSMLELVSKMNHYAHPLAHLVYFGRNEGQHSVLGDVEKTVPFIAVFDYAPRAVYTIEDYDISVEQDNVDTSDGIVEEMNTTMSA